MLQRLIGNRSSIPTLKGGLDASSRSVRRIAHRVANAGTPDFAEALDRAQAAGQTGAVDIEAEMVKLADEQLRFEATASLLQKAYQQVRSSIRER